MTEMFQENNVILILDGNNFSLNVIDKYINS